MFLDAFLIFTVMNGLAPPPFMNFTSKKANIRVNIRALTNGDCNVQERRAKVSQCQPMQVLLVVLSPSLKRCSKTGWKQINPALTCRLSVYFVKSQVPALTADFYDCNVVLCLCRYVGLFSSVNEGFFYLPKNNRYSYYANSGIFKSRLIVDMLTNVYRPISNK